MYLVIFNGKAISVVFNLQYQEIKNQFMVPIRTLQSDNAHEYLSHQFQTFTASQWHTSPVHQTSCAHTPQQNGVAEQKNRHHIETTRTLLLRGNVLYHF